MAPQLQVDFEAAKRIVLDGDTNWAIQEFSLYKAEVADIIIPKFFSLDQIVIGEMLKASFPLGSIPRIQRTTNEEGGRWKH